MQVAPTLAPYATQDPLIPNYANSLFATQKLLNQGYISTKILNWGQPASLALLWWSHAMHPQLDEPL